MYMYVQYIVMVYTQYIVSWSMGYILHTSLEIVSLAVLCDVMHNLQAARTLDDMEKWVDCVKRNMGPRYCLGWRRQKHALSVFSCNTIMYVRDI